jgi:hypothetical protein
MNTREERWERYHTDPEYSTKVDMQVEMLFAKDNHGIPTLREGMDIAHTFILDRHVKVFVEDDGTVRILPPDDKIIEDGQTWLRTKVGEKTRTIMAEHYPELIPQLREVGPPDVYDVPIDGDRLVQAQAPEGPTDEQIRGLLRRVAALVA